MLKTCNNRIDIVHRCIVDRVYRIIFIRMVLLICLQVVIRQRAVNVGSLDSGIVVHQQESGLYLGQRVHLGHVKQGRDELGCYPKRAIRATIGLQVYGVRRSHVDLRVLKEGVWDVAILRIHVWAQGIAVLVLVRSGRFTFLTATYSKDTALCLCQIVCYSICHTFVFVFGNGESVVNRVYLTLAYNALYILLRLRKLITRHVEVKARTQSYRCQRQRQKLKCVM